MKKISLLMGIFGLTGGAMLVSGSLNHQSAFMVAAEEATQTAEVTGVQVRSSGANNGYDFIVRFSC